MGVGINACAIVNVGTSSFDNSMGNNLDGDQILDKGRHSYTHWKGIFDKYPMKK